MMKKKVVLAVHGGAGIILRSQLTNEMEAQYRFALKDAMAAGYAILIGKGEERRDKESTSVAADAVEAAVRCLEDCPLFNAGRGSVFGNDEKIRMDASIMACYTENIHSCSEDGDEEKQTMTCNKTEGPHQIIHKRRYHRNPQPRAGAIAGVEHVKNPVSLARAVMERTPHVMLIGKGAEEFARSLPDEAGVEIQPDEYFWTERRWNQLVSVRERELQQQQQQQEKVGTAKLHTKQMMTVQLDHAAETNQDGLDHDHYKFGTVGCVALYIPETKPQLDNSLYRPQLASATSTGGMTNQRYMRVGDSPIIGSGTYANHLCAVSCTGHGEHFIRCVAAHDIAKRLEYKHGYGSEGLEEEGKNRQDGQALQKAVEEVIFGTLMGDCHGGDKGGDGGVIALDRDGNFVAELNCPGMYHGWIYEDGEMETKIFWDECCTNSNA